jgi:hypothetical protein
MKRTLYNLSMFAIAPIIGLIYVLALPVVSTGLLIWYTTVHYLPASACEMLTTILGPKSVDYHWMLKA